MAENQMTMFKERVRRVTEERKAAYIALHGPLPETAEEDTVLRIAGMAALHWIGGEWTSVSDSTGQIQFFVQGILAATNKQSPSQ